MSPFQSRIISEVGSDSKRCRIVPPLSSSAGAGLCCSFSGEPSAPRELCSAACEEPSGHSLMNCLRRFTHSRGGWWQPLAALTFLYSTICSRYQFTKKWSLSAEEPPLLPRLRSQRGVLWVFPEDPFLKIRLNLFSCCYIISALLCAIIN